MGCGASTQAAVREQVAAAVETAKAKATEAVANSKYYAIGCKFDPDAVSQEKSLGQLEKALKAARAGYGKWAKSFVPLSSALITHWAETTEMPQAGKDELKVVAASISRAAGEHKKFADAVLAELCVKGEAAIEKAQPALKEFDKYQEAEYKLTYERKTNSKKLAETEGLEDKLRKASEDALAAAKKAIAEALSEIENEILIPALSRFTAAAAAYCTAVADTTATDAAPAAAEDEEGEESVENTLKHADSDEYHANRFKGMTGKDAMEMARKKYAELKNQYKNVVIPQEFKDTEKQLELHKTHMYAITYKVNKYKKDSVPILFGPAKDVLKETLSKMPGFAALKKAIDDAAAMVQAANEKAGAFSNAVNATGEALNEIVDQKIKETKDKAMEYRGAVYIWKTTKDKIEQLDAAEAKMKQQDKELDEKKKEEKKKLEEEFPKLEQKSTDTSSQFYELSQAIYESEDCALVSKGVPAIKELDKEHIAFFESAKDCFVPSA